MTDQQLKETHLLDYVFLVFAVAGRELGQNLRCRHMNNHHQVGKDATVFVNCNWWEFEIFEE